MRNRRNRIEDKTMLMLPNEPKNKVLTETKILLLAFGVVVAALLSRGTNLTNGNIENRTSMNPSNIQEDSPQSTLRKLNQEYVKKVSLMERTAAERVESRVASETKAAKSNSRSIASVAPVKTAE